MKIMQIRNHSGRFLTLSLMAMAVMSAACKKKEETKAVTAPPTTVVVADVEQRTVPIYSEYIGQTKARETVELRARVEGTLEKVFFREGQPVRKGAILFLIDGRPFEASL